MIKDLSAKLVAAAAEINKKSREAYYTEQHALQEKIVAKQMKMPSQPVATKEEPASSKAKVMAKTNAGDKSVNEAAEGSVPKTPREKELAAISGNKKRITFGDVLKGRGVKSEEVELEEDVTKMSTDKLKKHWDSHKSEQRPSPAFASQLKMVGKELAKRKALTKEEVEQTQEGWDDMIKSVNSAKGTGKFDVKKTSTGTQYTRKSSTFEDGGKDTDMKKADKKMKQEQVEALDEGMHVMPMNNAKADSRHNAVMAHAKKMGYNVHHDEHYGDEKSGNKGTPDITVHYQRGDDRKSASPEAIQIHKSGKAAKDKTLKAHASGKAVSEEVEQIAEAMDTPGNSTHQCAIHVKSEQFGEGRPLFSQHAQPDADGNIAWYDVMFAEGIKRVETKDIQILASEGHMMHTAKKKKK